MRQDPLSPRVEDRVRRLAFLGRRLVEEIGDLGRRRRRRDRILAELMEVYERGDYWELRETARMPPM